MSKRDALWSRLKKLWVNPQGEKTSPAPISHAYSRFALFYGPTRIGELSFDQGLWTFKYCDEFKSSRLRTITEFPDTDKTYTSHELWPFFLMRIPSLRRETIKGIVAKEEIDSSDEVKLLDRFGRRTVSNPFELIKIAEGAELGCALSH